MAMNPPPPPLTIHNLHAMDDDSDEDMDYEPSLSASSSSGDISMRTSSARGASSSLTGIDLKSDPSGSIISSSTSRRRRYAAPTVVSDIFPDDSVSMRERNPLRPPSESSGGKSSVNGDEKEGGGGGVKGKPSEIGEDPSVVSFHSSVDGHLFKNISGRAFTNQTDLYLLPADAEEHARLDIQHYTLKLHIGGSYVSKQLVEYALREGQQVKPAVLDVGTGSGRWVLDMAAEFPWVDFIGTDLVPPALIDQVVVPPNVRFEVDDANLSMEHFANTFNVVHARSVFGGINDYDSLLYELARTLRPGGVLLLNAGYPLIMGEDLLPMPVKEPGQPGWTHHTFLCANTAYRSMGNFIPQLHWTRFLENNPNYQDVISRDTYLTLGPWRPNMSEREVFVSNLMRENCARILVNFRPLLITDGHKEADVDMWVENSIAELKELKIHGFIKWRYTVAIRTSSPWQERLHVDEPIEGYVADPPLEHVLSSHASSVGSRSSGARTALAAVVSDVLASATNGGASAMTLLSGPSETGAGTNLSTSSR